MGFWRRILRISWIAKKAGIKVMEEAGLTRSSVNEIRRHEAAVSGHVMKGEGLEHDGKAGGTKRHGETKRPKIENTKSVISASRDRGVWKGMVADAMRQDT